MDKSSDSEDDCYSNVAKKLENLKRKYQDDQIDSTNLLDDSVDTNSKTNSLNRNSDTVEIVSGISDEEYLNNDIELEELLASNSRRVTRSSRNAFNVLENANSSIITNIRRASKRGKRGSTNSNKNLSISVCENQRTVAVSRGRGRGRVRQSTRRRVTPHNITTISVGNTMDYPDQSETQTLFSRNMEKDVIAIDDSDILDENEELFIKVYWQSSEIFKFNIRKFQKLTTIFRHFAKKENVGEDKLLFTYNDKILKPDDTPDSINYNIAKFIDGGIINSAVSKLINNDHDHKHSGIKIKFQCQNVKKPFETVIQVDEKLALAMMKCAEHLEKSLTKLKFEFDGDSISGMFEKIFSDCLKLIFF